MSESKKCIHCKQPIPKDATTCKHCSKSQNRIISGLLFLASISALGIVVWWLVTCVKENTDLIQGDEIVIRELRTDEKVVIHNKGLRSLYLLRLEIQVPQLEYDSMVDLQETLKAGKILSKELGRKFADSSFAPFNDRWDIDVAKDNSDERLYPGVTLKSDPSYKKVQEEYRKDPRYNFNGFPCRGKLVFLSKGESREKTETLDCIGVILINLKNWSKLDYAQEHQISSQPSKP
ncbi:MAG: hypothetical protein R3B95_01670 [Nitrospirales bacterium]|nr:hypothetical protein [Nitrospirales bacterium]